MRCLLAVLAAVAPFVPLSAGEISVETPDRELPKLLGSFAAIFEFL